MSVTGNDEKPGGRKPSPPSKENGELIVRAEYDYEYTNTSGRVVTIKEGEEFELLKKTNGDWWQVRRFGERKPIYVPALYVVAVPRKLEEDSRRLARDDAQIQASDGPKPGEEKKRTHFEDIQKIKEDLRLSESAKRSAEDVRKPPEEPRNASDEPRKGGDTLPRKLGDGSKRALMPPQVLMNLKHVINNNNNAPAEQQLKTTRSNDKPVEDGPRIISVAGGPQAVDPSKPSSPKMQCAFVVIGRENAEGVKGKSNSLPGHAGGFVRQFDTVTPGSSMDDLSSGSNAHQTPPSGDLPPKVKRPDSPVYANLQDLKLMCPTTSLPQSTVAGGQISGDGWETLFDAKSSRHYYYNRITRETSWKPPRKQGRDPKSDQNWWKSKDDTGEVYYYTEDGRTEWELPEDPSGSTGVEWSPDHDLANTVPDHKVLPPTPRANDAPSHKIDHETKGLEKAGMLNKTKITEGGKKLRKNWTNVWVVLVGHDLILYKDPKSHTGWKQGASNSKPECCIDLRGAHIEWTRDKSSKKNVCQLTVSGANEFLLQSDNDHTMQEWYQSIRSLIARLDKDTPVPTPEEQRRGIPKPGAAPASSSAPGASTPDDGDVSGDDEPYEPSLRDKKDQRDSRKGHANEISDKKRSRLRKLITRRPTLQTLKDKGYIKEQVFGCPLACLCERENSMVPLFVRMCIEAIERRGLEIDGVYRVSGNQATIQKLRIMVDHDEHVDLDDSQWEDINVITGALKLFFRELPEPLVPYIFFEQFIAAIKIFEYHNRVKCMKDLINILPLPNHNTMKFLIRHLKTVVAHGEKNRMTMQNMAIVFAPTLLRPEVDPGNMAVHMVYQNQIVDLILGECDNIFGTD
ncbi:rho GTPase-activating protein 9-like isoform X2 [Lethenteron reissneri]|uniref:rho GTPase-activating protein 9-like isoform X2 n=1 Tax=Lethenteron reissneri TaxID=7753 RepID=UPI002AB7D29D|nr:rho GTPase-activating protein 9-like isoform X2 [Lethenteron reissneri]